MLVAVIIVVVIVGAMIAIPARRGGGFRRGADGYDPKGDIEAARAYERHRRNDASNGGFPPL